MPQLQWVMAMESSKGNHAKEMSLLTALGSAMEKMHPSPLFLVRRMHSDNQMSNIVVPKKSFCSFREQNARKQRTKVETLFA